MKTEFQQLATTASKRLTENQDIPVRSASGWTIVVRLFLGLGWARASVAKAVRGDWWDGTDVEVFIGDHDSATILWYRPLAQVLENSSAATAVLVLALEAAIAIALLTGRRMQPAIVVGVFLNLNFIFVGAPNPSVFYLIMQVSLGLWILETLAQSLDDLRLETYAVGALSIIGLACLPFITTLQPGSVIEDPAAVVATAALCTTVAYLVVRQRVAAEIDEEVVIVLE